MEKYIVAEITKNWQKDGPVTDLISQRFENVINVNFNRGYALKDWKISTVVISEANCPELISLTETIIAIFELKPVE